MQGGMMNVLVAISISPSGVGDKLSPYVAQAVKVIEDSGLPNRTNAMFTEIEGEWDNVMKVVKDAVMVLAEQGYRTGLVLKADVRPGHSDTMHKKLDALGQQLEKLKEKE